MPNNNVGFNERLYRANRLYLMTMCKRYHLGCVHCGGPFAWDAPPRTRWTFTVDHRIPRSKGGARDDLANMMPAHYTCNSARGNRPMGGPPTPGRTTRTPHNPHSEAWP